MRRSKLSLCGFAIVAALMLSGGSVRALDVDYKIANSVMPGCRLALSPTASNDPFDQGILHGFGLRNNLQFRSMHPNFRHPGASGTSRRAVHRRPTSENARKFC